MIEHSPVFAHITCKTGASRTIARIIEVLSARGYHIGSLRYAESMDWGQEIPDSSAAAAVFAGQKLFIALKEQGRAQQIPVLGRLFADCHVVLIENGSPESRERIEIMPDGETLREGMPPDSFSADNITGICDFLEARYLRPQLSAAIMAGGKSSRLGRNKALLELGGSTVIEHVLAAVSAIAQPVNLITNSPEDYTHLGIPMSRDIRPGCGPLSGIHAALSLAATPYVLVKSCDIPLVRTEHLRQLCASYTGHDITIFKTSRFEPLCAVYRRTCLPALEELIDHGEYRIIDLFPCLDVRVIRTPDHEVFRSINTDEDYEIIKSKFETMCPSDK